MDLLGKKITYKGNETGTVVEFDGTFITIEFMSKTMKFQYPDAFAKWLTAEDDNIQAAILEELTQVKAEKAEAKRLEEEKQKVGATKSDKCPVRNECKRRTFFVFQGRSFDTEYRGGYIWAPKCNSEGQTFHYWDRLTEVKKGNIILNGAGGYIKAISVAEGPCYDAENPNDLKDEMLWVNNGRRVDCEYTKIKNPIKTADYKDTIIKYCNVKFAPFDKNGDGIMGYLFDINQDLARFFVEKTAKKNSYILDLDYIQELLGE